jgi:hypothetical protein
VCVCVCVSPVLAGNELEMQVSEVQNVARLSVLPTRIRVEYKALPMPRPLTVEPAIKVTMDSTEMFLRRTCSRTTNVLFTALLLLILTGLLMLTVTLIQLCLETLNWCIELGPFVTPKLLRRRIHSCHMMRRIHASSWARS